MSMTKRELLDRLAREAQTLSESEGWLAWLDFARRFRSYSLRNQLLIASQCPQATRVAGYQTWRSLGRQVKRGQKGLSILAPTLRKVESDESADGATVPSRTLTGFRVVHVFDVSQTEGDALPELVFPSVQAAPEHFYELETVAGELGLSVETVEPPGSGARGWINVEEKVISLARGFDLPSQTRTLLHELAHWFDAQGSGWPDSTRAERELVAESAAYLASRELGIDLDDASVFYTMTWGLDASVVPALAERALSVSADIEAAIETSRSVPFVA
jgi:antirestriction protein ArdC